MWSEDANPMFGHILPQIFMAVCMLSVPWMLHLGIEDGWVIAHPQEYVDDVMRAFQIRIAEATWVCLYKGTTKSVLKQNKQVSYSQSNTCHAAWHPKDSQARHPPPTTEGAAYGWKAIY